MYNEYSLLKHAYKYLFNDDYNLPKINILNCEEESDTTKVDYVNSLIKNFHIEYDCTASMEQAAKTLNISTDEFESLILETICSNLYLDLIVILQHLDQKNSRYTHEQFLRKFTDFYTSSRKSKERFRKLVEAQRLGFLNRLKYSGRYPDDTSPQYYIPTLAQFYKETLLLKRYGTNIFDISKYFADIFYFLMYEEDDQVEYDRSKKLIKEYRLWEISESEVAFIKAMYSSIGNSKSSPDEKFAEFMLLEKAFGLLSASEIAKFTLEDKDYWQLLRTAFQMRRFAFTRLHEVFYSNICQDNIVYYVNMMQKYILPLCDEVYTTLLKEIIFFVCDSNTEDKTLHIQALHSTLKDRISPEIFSNNLSYLTSNPSVCMPEIIKRICGSPLGISDARIHEYIQFYSLSHFPEIYSTTSEPSEDDCSYDETEFAFNERYYNNKYDSINCEIVDRSYLSLSLEELSFCCDDLPANENKEEEEHKKNFIRTYRIKY